MERRRFFHWLSWLFSLLCTAFMAVPGMGFLLAPLGQTRKQARRHRVAKLADLEQNIPRKVVLFARRTDAWTHYPEGPIGAVWVVRRGKQDVDVFTVTCPHLGCPVEHVASEEKFFCPCHAASFSLDGNFVSGPALRGMDRLHVKLETIEGEEWVSVVFQKFELGTEERRSLG